MHTKVWCWEYRRIKKEELDMQLETRTFSSLSIMSFFLPWAWWIGFVLFTLSVETVLLWRWLDHSGKIKTRVTRSDVINSSWSRAAFRTTAMSVSDVACNLFHLSWKQEIPMVMVKVQTESTFWTMWQDAALEHQAACNTQREDKGLGAYLFIGLRKGFQRGRGDEHILPNIWTIDKFSL